MGPRNGFVRPLATPKQSNQWDSTIADTARTMEPFPIPIVAFAQQKAR